MRFFLVFALLLAGCGLPRDPDETLKHIREDKIMRVGAIERADRPTGAAEAVFVRRIADRLDARVALRTGDTERLLEALKAGELDLVVGPLSRKSPWAAEVALIDPLTKEGDTPPLPFSAAAPAGENAWVSLLEAEARDLRGGA
ncbi:hypothetical protein [Sphingomonas gilva]|nr:hypothetical protein [Sphingomonas gilva]